MNPQQQIPVSRQGLLSLLDRIRSPLYRNSLFLMVNSAVTAGVGFFFWMVVARSYDKWDVGFGSATLSAISLLAALSLFGANTTIIRFLPKAEKPVDLINTCLTVCGMIAIVIAIIFILGLDFWSPALIFIKQNIVFATAFILFVVVSTFLTILNSTYIAKRRANYVLIQDLTHSILKIPLPALLVLLSFHSFGIASSLGIAMIVAVIIGIFILVPRAEKGFTVKPVINRNIIGNLWRYSTGNYLSAILNSAPGWILPILVVNMLGSEENAYYYITWILAMLLASIPIATSNSLFAEGSHFETDLQLNLRKTLRFTYLLLVPAIIIMQFLGGWILSLFGPGYSYHGLTLLRLLAVSFVFFGVNSIYFTTLRIENRITELCCIYALQGFATLTTSYFLIDKIGTIGIGYTYLGVRFITCLYVVFNLIRRYFKSKNVKTTKINPEVK